MVLKKDSFRGMDSVYLPHPQCTCSSDFSAASVSFHSHRIQNCWSPHITFMPLNMPERAKIKINGRKRSCKIPLTEPFN